MSAKQKKESKRGKEIVCDMGKLLIQQKSVNVRHNT